MTNHPNRKVSAEFPSPPPLDIAAARESAGLSVEEAARRVLTTRSTWNKWENGRSRMPAGLWRLFQLETQLRQLAPPAPTS